MARPVYYYQNNQRQLTATQVAEVAYQAGFRGEDLVRAVAISKRESSWKPAIHGTDADPSRVSGDRGLFQINYTWDNTLKRAGIIRQSTDLFDPLTNARAAHYIYEQAGNSFAPAWSVGASGWDGTSSPLQGTNPDAVRADVKAVESGIAGGTIKPMSWWSDWLNDIPINPMQPIGGPSIGGVLPGGIGDLAGVAKNLLSVQWWIRVVQVVGGIILILLGLNVMVVGDVGGTVIKAVT